MSDLYLTKHSEIRMRQRGFRKADVDLVISVATRVAEDAYLLTCRDAAREIEKRRREIQQLERLQGSKLIVEGGALITLYHEDAGRSRHGIRKFRRLS